MSRSSLDSIDLQTSSTRSLKTTETTSALHPKIMDPNRNTRHTGHLGRFPSLRDHDSNTRGERLSSRRSNSYQPPATQSSRRDPRHQGAGQACTSRSSASQTQQSTVVRPRQPHVYGSRTNRVLARVESTLCRCPNPDSHGDAFTIDGHYGTSVAGQPLTYQQGWSALLDYYGKDAISDLDVRAGEPYIFDQPTIAYFEREYQQVEAGIRMGATPEFKLDLAVTHHNGDGHSQPHVTEEGLRTRIDRSGYSRRE